MQINEDSSICMYAGYSTFVRRIYQRRLHVLVPAARVPLGADQRVGLTLVALQDVGVAVQLVGHNLGNGICVKHQNA